MKYFFMVILFVITSLNAFPSQWRVATNLDSNDNSNNWNYIASYDNSNILMVGADGSGVLRVALSKDTGATWKYIHNETILEHFEDTNFKYLRPNAVHFDKNRIFICAYEQNENQSYFVKSFDAGKTWETEKTNIPGLNVIFQNNYGVIICSDTIYSTDNGGIDWSKQYYNISGTSGYIRKINIESLNKISMMINEPNQNKTYYCKTSDRGLHWEIDTIPYYCDYTSFSTINNVVWVIGDKSNGVGDQKQDIVLKSLDNGHTWQKIVDSTYQNSLVLPFGLFDIDAISENEAIAVGSDRKVIYTNNGGSTWSILYAGLETYDLKVFYTVKFINPKVVIGGGFSNMVARLDIDNVATSVYEAEQYRSDCIIENCKGLFKY